MIEKELKKQGLTYSQLFKPEWVEILLRKYTFNTMDDLNAAIGYGAMTANKIISRLKEEYRKTLKVEDLALQTAETVSQKPNQNRKSIPENGVVVKGIENCLVRISRCCNPVPGDDITGYITRGRGVSVHRSDCANVTNNIDGDTRLIDVDWYMANNNVSYNAEVTVLANDRTALLMEITNVIGESKIPLKAINARTTKDQIAVMNLTMEITNTEQLEKIIKKLKKVDGVFEVTRSKQ